jgi:hypothetical protein
MKKMRYKEGGSTPVEVEKSSGIGIEEVLGTISPFYGMATGKGMFGNDVGLLPMLARDIRDDRSKKNREKNGDLASVSIEIEKSGEMEEPMGMNRSGRMGYAKGGMARGNRDGCAIRGKTKGRMV